MPRTELLTSLCKRRGFVFQGSEIYGGVGSVWDYGPVGAELKRNVKEAWWNKIVKTRDDIVGLDSAIIMHRDVWRASGHLESFTDPLVECRSCNRRFRSDEADDNKCIECGGELGGARDFNLMFETAIGPLKNSSSTVYLRPETAQGIFVNFVNVLNATRRRLPFGIAQIGKSFRNEITPGNFIYRTREFEQMEMEFFCAPGEDEKWHEYWIQFSLDWYAGLGLQRENLRVREHGDNELPHYSKASVDVEYKFSWGWGELETVSNRGDHDLAAHTQLSKKELSYYDETTKKRFTPFVVEPAIGVDRSILAFLSDAYDEEEINGEQRTVMRFHPDIAPFQVAVLPLSRNSKLIPTSRKVYDLIRPMFNCQYDDTQSIGRRYRRQDEIGTPLCITVDFQTVEEDYAVTVRDRDTMKQVRTDINSVPKVVKSELDRMRGELEN